jgi:hypothetical protein
MKLFFKIIIGCIPVLVWCALLFGGAAVAITWMAKVNFGLPVISRSVMISGLFIGTFIVSMSGVIIAFRLGEAGRHWMTGFVFFPLAWFGYCLYDSNLSFLTSAIWLVLAAVLYTIACCMQKKKDKAIIADCYPNA